MINLREKNSPEVGINYMARRVAVYCLGIVILALGITLNTKAALGVSPIISIPYALSKINNLELGTITFVIYCVFIFVQLLLLRKDFKLSMLLQVVASFLTSLFISIFNRYIFVYNNIYIHVITLVAAVVITGVGAAIVVDMDLVPNPADGLADVIGQKLKRDFGFGKNVFDLICIIISSLIGFIFRGKLIGIGFGTIFAMIFTGRVIAVFNKKFKKRLQEIIY